METAKIWSSIEELAQHLDSIRDTTTIVATSGGFSPIHRGHCRCILSSSELGELVVIVNDDGFLLRKKGIVFIPIEDRLEIVASMRGVKHVIAWDDGTQFVHGALALIKPHLFTKGGDRSTIESIAEPELEICKYTNCKIVLGVGGNEKSQSSSALIRGSSCQFSIEESLSNRLNTQR